MKYVIMFTETPESYRDVSEERHQQIYQRVWDWFQDNDGEIADGGAQLQPVATATTVKSGPNGPVVVDGPFTEAKEVVGGFSIIDVPDLDAAIALVKTWPEFELPGIGVEIRPMVTDYSQFE
ncbi:YciI family protein [Microbacterium sp. 22242]|uniref:YciI family protein n=1 Tax=Microbacterium sp. 22242 TaxID=3453896 RepID=UPI003F8275C9